MAKTLTTALVWANLLICSLALQGQSSSSSMTTRVPTPTPLPTTPSGPVTSEPPTSLPANTFILKNEDNKTCAMMTANLTITFTYTNSSNTSETVTFVDSADRRANVYTELDCTGDGVQPCSYCTGDKAVLVLTWKPLGGSDEIDDRFLSFNFGASHKKGSQHWTFDGVELLVRFDKNDFPDYSNKMALFNNLSYSMSGFFDSNNDKVEFERGYQCNAPQEFQLKNVTDNHQINASLTVKDFQVQAFVFKHPGQFGNTRRCPADSGDGNKIVPIAVGIALAVLVVIVFIAFLISKIVNRKKSSYEALN